MNEIPESTTIFPVMEHFYTIQGEGANVGKAAYFIRLGGCDVGCVWCDVKESWDASSHPLLSIEKIIDLTKNSPAESLVITGGEPLMYNLELLTDALRNEGLRIWLETSGAYPVTGNWDWIVFSPKKFKAPHPDIFQQAHELKIIVYNKSDFDWAEKYAALVNPSCRLFLQPEWSREKEMSPLIVDYVKQHPRWQISLQTHKYLQIP
jgi:organic radical activating enzyme